MKAEDIFTALGNVDDDLLLGAQKQPALRHRPRWGVLVAAAIAVALAASAAAVGIRYASQPIGGSELKTDPTAVGAGVDAQGNLRLDGVEGTLIYMQVQAVQDAPETIENAYSLSLFDSDWQLAVQDISQIAHYHSQIAAARESWILPGHSGALRLQQLTMAHLDHYGEDCVDRLLNLPAGLELTATVTVAAELEVLKVQIPAFTDPVAAQYYCPEGETRLYWSDGSYILCYVYPSWLEETEALRILENRVLSPVKEMETTYVPEQIHGGGLDFIVQEGGAWGNMAGMYTSDGRAVLRDGCIWFSGPQFIGCYTLETGELTRYAFHSIYPKTLFVTRDHILFTLEGDPGRNLYRMPKTGEYYEKVLEGSLGQIYLEGTILYQLEEDRLTRTDLASGQRQVLVEQGAGQFFITEDSIYVTGGEYISYDPDFPALSEKTGWLLVSHKEQIQFTRTELSYWPGGIYADKTGLYLSESGDPHKRFVHILRDGQDTVLEISSAEFQVAGGKLYFWDEKKRDSRYLRTYALADGQLETLHGGMHAFSVLEERYLMINYENPDGKTVSPNWILMDLQTGEQRTLSVDE